MGKQDLLSRFGIRKPKRRRFSKDVPQPGRSWYEGLKDVFGMHVQERRGFLVMAFLLVLWAGWLTYKQWFMVPVPFDLGAMRTEVEAFMVEDEHKFAVPDASIIEPFDPNNLDKSGWMALGLSDRQASGIMRWVERGGRFRSKADVAKMYSIKPEQFAVLAPFMLLPDSAEERPRYTEHRERKPWPERDTAQRKSTWPAKPVLEVVEVNTADSAALTALPGIGPSFARGIIKYRNQLGGYVSIDQLNEVFVLRDKPDAVKKIVALLRVDASQARKLNINTATAEDFTGHPYLWKKWSIAKAIVAYRTQHGPYATVEDIKKCLLVDDELLGKLSPYLTTGP